MILLCKTPILSSQYPFQLLYWKDKKNLKEPLQHMRRFDVYWTCSHNIFTMPVILSLSLSLRNKRSFPGKEVLDCRDWIYRPTVLSLSRSVAIFKRWLKKARDMSWLGDKLCTVAFHCSASQGLRSFGKTQQHG